MFTLCIFFQVYTIELLIFQDVEEEMQPIRKDGNAISIARLWTDVFLETNIHLIK